MSTLDELLDKEDPELVKRATKKADKMRKNMNKNELMGVIALIAVLVSFVVGWHKINMYEAELRSMKDAVYKLPHKMKDKLTWRCEGDTVQENPKD